MKTLPTPTTSFELAYYSPAGFAHSRILASLLVCGHLPLRAGDMLQVQPDEQVRVVASYLDLPNNQWRVELATTDADDRWLDELQAQLAQAGWEVSQYSAHQKAA